MILLKRLSNIVYCVEDEGGGETLDFRMQIFIDGVEGLLRAQTQQMPTSTSMAYQNSRA
jgi:hypothetical protein